MVNQPVSNWLAGNTAETIFNRLEQHGKTWKVYVGEPDRFSATGLIHYPRLKDRFATHFVPFAQFEADAAAGDLPDFSYIEPCLILGHGDYHPAAARALGHGIVIPGGLGQTITAIGTTVFNGIRAYAEQHGIQIEGLPADPDAEIPPEQALHIIHNFLAIQFPLLHPAVPGSGSAARPGG